MSKHLMTRGGALILAVLAVGCGYAEQRVVDQYFGAVNAQDNQTLSSFALVKFDQKVDKWKIVSVSAETKTPVTLPDLVKTAKDIDKQIADNKKAASAYFLDHPAVAQVTELLRKDAKIPANLQATATEWEKFNQKDRDLKKALAEAKDAVEREKRNVQLSVGDNITDVESQPGEMTAKDLEMSLTIKGEAKPYTMGLRKYELQTGQAGRAMSRWVVHSLEPKG
jgi:hypothetical protein